MFHELLDNPDQRESGQLQADARHSFPSLVRKSNLEPRAPGSPVPSGGQYAIIGVATYSRDELRLLDELNAGYPHWNTLAKVAVFDVLECKCMDDMRSYMPAFTVVRQTPVVAVWDSGKLVAAQTGLRMTRETLQSAGLLK